jgi:histidine triad (HIT) family protein
LVLCIFCKIICGEAEASLVYRDEMVTAFMDLHPVNPGHVLLVPNRHVQYLSELEPEIGGQMFKMAMRVANAVRIAGVKCEGVNLHLADGEAAGQEILHSHLHIIPRYAVDGFGLKFGPNYPDNPSRNDLDVIANKIKTYV